ncbi:3-oxoacyl-ACP synthase III family protein [Pseudahrensia aquimaris]|uniref:3-oxoacyl-ACP synthase III family protein n=1 Tax=Pseudahrensia aquimaris TaxID=744461 RepID=UPI00366C24B6
MEAKTGVSSRYFCDEENQIDLGVAAAKTAISKAGIDAQDIDLIISACAVPFQPIPATAPAIQRALSITDGTCFATDINCTCLGFPAALEFANGLIGAYSKILIVSSELASRGLPWKTQPDVAGLFGDGAAAAVLTSAPSKKLFAARFETHASAYDNCSLAAGGTRFDFAKQPDMFAAHSQFTMDGKELFRLTAKHFGSFVEKLLASTGLQQNDIDLVIPHQASPSALAHMIKLCGFKSERVVNIASQVGNQIAASIPFTLDYANESGLIKRGDRILMLGTSAGVSFGGIVMGL